MIPANKLFFIFYQPKPFAMKKNTTALFLFALLLQACSEVKEQKEDGTANKSVKETFPISNLVAENKQAPDSVIEKLNAQHHQLKVLERRSVPGPFTVPEMKYYYEHAVTLDKLPVINPGPGEYVHVMEGQRHGYKNLTIGITETYPGGAPPMHSHEGEESHVLLEGDILYALGDTTFTIKAPLYGEYPWRAYLMRFKNIGQKNGKSCRHLSH